MISHIIDVAQVIALLFIAKKVSAIDYNLWRISRKTSNIDVTRHQTKHNPSRRVTSGVS